MVFCSVARVDFLFHFLFLFNLNIYNKKAEKINRDWNKSKK